MQVTDLSVFQAALEWLSHGLLHLQWWQIVLVTLLLTHITMISVTVFLHRHQAHRALDLHPIASHFFRFWLWLTTGQVTREWASIHRKHHAKCEQPEDPHSPHVYGIKTVLLQGYELYRKEASNQETMARYGHGTPNDWLERNLYTRFSTLGIALMLVIDLALFGAAGVGRMGGADDVDPGDGGGHHQWCSALLGLPQFRSARRQHQHFAVGHPDCG
jgi:stearoyl-CoA desaturase (delta-9 desaturase)